MEIDTDTVTGWFVLNSGFKVYGRCPSCHSPRISFYKERKPGLKGISSTAKGITPVCIDCGKSLPKQNPKGNKQTFMDRPLRKRI